MSIFDRGSTSIQLLLYVSASNVFTTCTRSWKLTVFRPADETDDKLEATETSDELDDREDVDEDDIVDIIESLEFCIVLIQLRRKPQSVML
jgi:hypothetical protein